MLIYKDYIICKDEILKVTAYTLGQEKIGKKLAKSKHGQSKM